MARPTTEPLAPSSTEGVLTSENGINAVGIAVGVPVGVVILILVVVLVVVFVIKKKTIWRRSFKPSSEKPSRGDISIAAILSLIVRRSFLHTANKTKHPSHETRFQRAIDW